MLYLIIQFNDTFALFNDTIWVFEFIDLECFLLRKGNVNGGEASTYLTEQAGSAFHIRACYDGHQFFIPILKHPRIVIRSAASDIKCL